MMRGVTQYRCATRPFGSTTFRDTLVEEVIVESMDPSVALTGSALLLLLRNDDAGAR